MVDVWMKDDSGDEILAEFWGRTSAEEAKQLKEGMVLQLDCVSVRVHGTGKRTLTRTSVNSLMVIIPKGMRSDELVKLGPEKGNRISEDGSGSGFSQMDTTGQMYPAQRSLPQSPSLRRLASDSILNDSLGSPA